MSLDIHLISERKKKKKIQEYHSGIFIRSNGQTKEITDEEWEERYPGKIPMRVTLPEEETDEVFHANITHNMGKMAMHADIYFAMWRPKEKQWRYAKDIIPTLQEGIERLEKDPEYFKQYDPENGWGNYELLVQVAKDYLKACRQYPDAKIEVSR